MPDPSSRLTQQQPDPQFPIIEGRHGDHNSLLRLLQSEQNLLELRKDSGLTRSLLQALAAIYRRARLNSSFVTLLDFDVVAHFVQTGTYGDSGAGLDSLALDVFFIDGDSKYALPLGAYRELLRYLRFSGLTKKNLPEGASNQRNLDRNAVIRELLSYISVDDIGVDDDPEEIAEDLVYSIPSNKVQLTRLLSIFLNPRFDGIRKNVNTRERDAWKIIQEAHPRKWASTNKDQIIENDSINLAIALSDFMAFAESNEHRDEGREGFLLLSRTGGIFNLLRNINRNHVMREKCSEYFGCIPSVALQDEFPVITPQRVALFEWFGAPKTPTEAERLYQLALRCSFSCKTVENDADVLLEAVREKTFDKYYEARSQHLVENFERLVAVAKEVHEFEERRRGFASLRDIAKRALSEPAGNFTVRRQTDERRVLNDLFLDVSTEAPHLLDQINLALQATGGPDYNYETTRFEDNRIGFVVYERGSIRNKILEGSFLLRPDGSGKVLEYQARWIVTTSEIEFRSALEGLFPKGLAGDKRPSTTLSMRPISSVGTYTKCPVVCITPQGDFGIFAPDVLQDFKWLDLSYLGRLCERDLNQVPKFEQIKINADGFSISYDLWPKNGIRYVTVTSANKLEMMIGSLVYHSTQYYTDRDALVVCLEKLFALLIK